MTVWSIKEQEITSNLDESIRQMLCCCFVNAAEEFRRSRSWHGSFPSWSVLATNEQRQIVGHIGIVERTIQDPTGFWHIGGLQNVCVIPDCRGQGIAHRLLCCARERMEREKLDAGLLFCNRPLVALYQRAGWHTLANASFVLMNQNGVQSTLPEGSLAMWLPLGKSYYPSGTIDLKGSDW